MKRTVLLLVSFLLILSNRSVATDFAVTNVNQNTKGWTARGITFSYMVNEPGLLAVKLEAPDQTVHDLLRMNVDKGRMEVQWDGNLNGNPVPDGTYSISLLIDTGEGFIPASRKVTFQKEPISPPITNANDGTYWSMTEGELDDAEIWRLLTQPITVFDNGRIDPSGHTYLMENPDGTGRKIAQIHGLSQGLHVLGETNPYGYCLVEAYSNYDPSYQPVKPDEIEHAFDLKRGYIRAEYLKTVQVSQTYGLLVDKLTQRMYLFRDGVRAAEFVISTGLVTNRKYFRETVPGEFTTIAYREGFWSDEVYSAYGIRYNGGSLIHEVPSYINEDGTRNHAPFERVLGTKASGNCVRVQRIANPLGLNQQWLYETLKNKDPYGKQERYKVIIWDDRNRVDKPTVWFHTPYTSSTAAS